jgi:hypothetical protein
MENLMPIRFMLLWLIASAAIYALVFVATRRNRKNVWKLWKRAAISFGGGVLVVLPLFFLNNISGV